MEFYVRVLTMIYKRFQIVFKAIYIRTQRHYPIIIESFFYEKHLFSRHVS